MFYIFIVAIGLAMDAFGVSIALGSVNVKNFFIKGLMSSTMFGLFQAGMPVVGWTIGRTFSSYITSVDHWIAFLLLFVIGLKMILADRSKKHNLLKQKSFNVPLLLSLAVATSIDALIVGMGIAFLNVPMILTVSIIGLVTFTLSLTGIYLGETFGKFFQNKVGLIGGVFLIIIGIKILTENLI